MKKILIVEDDKTLQEELKNLLNNASYNAVVLDDFFNAKETILKNSPDLILLDINIPNVNGEVLLKQIRNESNVPIIMVTSKDTEIDEVLCMSYGADDYITKPYNPTILLLRVAAIFKRIEQEPEFLKYEDLKIIPRKGIIIKGNETTYLSKNEMLILTLLISNRSKIVERETIVTELWDNDEFIDDNTLTVNISRLRNKLRDIGYSNMIETRKNQGYIIL